MDAFHEKSGEVGEGPNSNERVTPSQASEGKGSEEGVETTRVSPNNNLSHEPPSDTELAYELGWFAGIFDGEGCLTMRHCGRGIGYSPHFEITTSSEAMILKVKKIIMRLGIESGTISKKSVSVWGRRDIFRFSLSSSQAVIFVLMLLLPYLTAKQPFAQAVIELFKGRSPRSPWTDEQVKAAKEVRMIHMPNCIM